MHFKEKFGFKINIVCSESNASHHKEHVLTLEIIRNLEALHKKSKRKLILKSKNLWSVSKASHSKKPCLPLATKSDLKLEVLDAFQNKIWFQNQYPLF